MERDLRIAVFGQKRLSREGGVEIVVKELCTRMAQQGCQVTCYNRSGHHVSGAEYDDIDNTNYEGIRQKSVPTIEKKGARDIIGSKQSFQKPPTYNPQDFPLLAVFQQIKHLKDNSSRQNHLVIVGFLG